MREGYPVFNETQHLSGAELELATDALLPVQYRDLFTSKEISPEKHLLIYVLKQAMSDYEHPELTSYYESRQQMVRPEVRAWIESDQARDIGRFTFVAICEALGLDVSATRRMLRRQMAKIDAGQPITRWGAFERLTVPSLAQVA